jgi:hypothetical protein
MENTIRHPSRLWATSMSPSVALPANESTRVLRLWDLPAASVVGRSIAPRHPRLDGILEHGAEAWTTVALWALCSNRKHQDVTVL